MDGELQRRFGEAVRAHRRSLGMSQEQFADALNHNRTYIGAIERGDRNLTLCTVEKFASLLGKDAWLMMAPPGYQQQSPED